MKRIFLIVLDSFGIGALPDAPEYGDEGVNTIKSCSTSNHFHMPNMRKLGLFDIEGVDCSEKAETLISGIARMGELSKGKDTTIGHWEIAGIVSKKPLPTYPDGFPKEVLDKFIELTGKEVVCNKPYSGTEVIKAYGKEHVETGRLILYTSADSVFQIAAHEDIVALEELYRYCTIAREMLTGKHGVGRVIARPFTGSEGNYTRTINRHDYSLLPPAITMLDQLSENGLSVIGVGKIKDIFVGKGITEYTYTKGNEDGINKTLAYMDKDFKGLCFVNLVDYDMLYGHRNDIDGYAKALAAFDKRLPEIMNKMKEEDILMITADHGCDPGYVASTDHSREYIPFIMYGKAVEAKNYGTRNSFADIGATVLKYFSINQKIHGKSLI